VSLTAVIVSITDVHINISGLYFTPRCPEDSGYYEVTAINDYGFEEASAFIDVVCQYRLNDISGSHFWDVISKI